ncbi:UDP-N-acetylenolpyruvoylglucosamine reductase [Neokomagataea thailandica NBRC 106555]|uniref:UDP-N-acetylenolpyruvoylglucosamine reductase n=2 Tax=Neokomagataea TaxID=1223423 RepID=A0A4Y6V5H8_9PROT|nr:MULTISPECIES: UDP-N-acetylmuramate dehydrogenase [Neokomagataea]QDH24128.1 UDP-N-acetylmuramate dehydrogenase [Neokomagataea tanensis]GBR50462.1 UDP-N-acetylenolpyruvoylglucosamine reductase [Neokomagataea thailandica NBRC 106555]
MTALDSTAPDFTKNLRGRLKAAAPLGPRCWFRTGGPADWLFVPEDEDDLATLLKNLPENIPLTVLGACSNVIIRDGGLEGVVVKLARGFADIQVEENGIIAGSAALDITVAEHAAAASLDGLAFLSGIPGSIGGAIRMNAGAYGSDIATVFDWADIMLPNGNVKRFTAQELAFAYRYAQMPERSVVLRARLHATRGDTQLIRQRMDEIKASREASQPVRARTGGSTFRNPDGHKAWALIDEAGCRGLLQGGAQMSEKHCNFMLNLGEATSTDLETLGETVRQRVLQHSGIDLHWEIKRIGRHSLPAQEGQKP